MWPLAGFRSWLAFGPRHQVLTTWTSSHGLLTVGPLASLEQGLWKRKSETKVTVFWEPNHRSGTNYFDYGLSIRSKSLGQSTAKRKDYTKIWVSGGFPGGSVVKSPPPNAGDAGLIPGSGRSSGGGSGNPLQYSCLRHPTHRGAWWATVRGVTESDMPWRLNSSVSVRRPGSLEATWKTAHCRRHQSYFFTLSVMTCKSYSLLERSVYEF